MKHFLIVTLLAAPGVFAQTPSLKARELFYTPPPDAVKPAEAKSTAKKAPAPVKPVAATKSGETHTLTASVPLGLRYAVLKRDTAGQYNEVDPDTNFRSGDRIRLHVDANTTGYLYVVMQGSSGTWKLLFPSAEVAGGSNLVHKGDSRQIPSGDKGQFFFDEQAGNEKLFIVLTRQPEADLDKLIYAMGGSKALVAQASVGDDMVSKLRNQVKSRDLVFEKSDSNENAAYVVNPSTAPDARLVVDVALKHK